MGRTGGKKTLRAEACDPATTPRRLRELAGSGWGREVAANPNAPVDLLLKLAARHFDSFLANLVLPLLLLEDPGLFHKLTTPSLRRLLRGENLPENLLASLCRHKDAEVRQSARLHVRSADKLDAAGDPVLQSLGDWRADVSSLP